MVVQSNPSLGEISESDKLKLAERELSPYELDLITKNKLNARIKKIYENSLYYPLVAEDKRYGFRDPKLLTDAKRDYLETVVQFNLLAKAVYERQRVNSTDSRIVNSNLNNRPLTVFNAHELLRKTRDLEHSETSVQFKVGEITMDRDEFLGHYKLLVPNTNLKNYNHSYVFFSSAEVVSVAVAGIAGLVAASSAANGEKFDLMWGLTTGISTEIALRVSDRLLYKRELGKTPPWDSSIYLDTHLALLRDHPDDLHMARDETIPKTVIKTGNYYGLLSRQIESGSFYPRLKENYARALKKAA